MTLLSLNIHRMKLILFLAVVAMGIGCSSETRVYQVSVKNDASRPITIGQVKDGAPEEMFVSPEDLAIARAREGDQMWGVVVPPGRTANSGGMKGRFERTDSAWLRVYAGKLSFSELLAISRGNPNRVDVRLHPGRNDFVVTDKAGRIEVTPAEPRSSAAPMQ
jgi:hypothetical protein